MRPVIAQPVLQVLHPTLSNESLQSPPQTSWEHAGGGGANWGGNGGGDGGGGEGGSSGGGDGGGGEGGGDGGGGDGGGGEGGGGEGGGGGDEGGGDGGNGGDGGGAGMYSQHRSVSMLRSWLRPPERYMPVITLVPGHSTVPALSKLMVMSWSSQFVRVAPGSPQQFIVSI